MMLKLQNLGLDEEDKLILCEKCAGRIQSRDDLITTLAPIRLVAYHNRCFAEEIKGFQGFFMDHSPVNGTLSTIGAVIFAIVVLLSFLFDWLPWYGHVFLSLFCAVRLASWISYERHV